MAPSPNTDRSAVLLSQPSWMWLAVVVVLVAGSLLFWSLLGIVWLATRPSPSPTPVIVYVQPAEGGLSIGKAVSEPFQPSNPTSNER